MSLLLFSREQGWVPIEFEDQTNLSLQTTNRTVYLSIGIIPSMEGAVQVPPYQLVTGSITDYWPGSLGSQVWVCTLEGPTWLLGPGWWPRDNTQGVTAYISSSGQLLLDSTGKLVLQEN
jgi:hypothetical protein